MKSYYCLIVALTLILDFSSAFGQDRAFENLAIGVHIGHPIAGSDLLNSWKPEPSLQLFLETPFYAGEIETGIRYTRFSNSTNFSDFSDFNSFFIYLGWGYDFAISDKLSASPGLRFGNTFFQYDEAMVYTRPNVGWEYDFDTTESEFAYEINFRTAFRISQSISVHTELTYNRTITFHPISLNYINAGFTYTFDAPKWLKKILR